MQETSALYKELLIDPNHYAETSLVIGDGTPDDGYKSDVVLSIETEAKFFQDDLPSVGNCIGAEITVEMLHPEESIPKMARMRPFFRLTDGKRHSEWLQKGEFWIDTREEDIGNDGIETITLVGYDGVRKYDVDFPLNSVTFPANETQILNAISKFTGIAMDSSISVITSKPYGGIQMPTGYSCREVLCYIAAAHGGSFVMSDTGKLRFIQLNQLPPDTSLLCTSDAFRFTIVFEDGVRILV